MARLFITPREIDFIADLGKEITKDVMGQVIYYYKVREDLTDVHDVYEESPDKVFDPPLIIDAYVAYDPGTASTSNFGHELTKEIEVHVQSRDLFDRNISIKEGDFFSYGDVFYEITSVLEVSTVFGQVEHKTGLKLVGKQARKGLIDKDPIGPTDENYTDEDAVQETFEQQRGLPTTSDGQETGDVRQLQKDGKIEPPSKGAKVSRDGISSSFYTDHD